MLQVPNLNVIPRKVSRLLIRSKVLMLLHKDYNELDCQDFLLICIICLFRPLLCLGFEIGVRKQSRSSGKKQTDQ